MWYILECGYQIKCGNHVNQVNQIRLQTASMKNPFYAIYKHLLG
jgi:hypothetical protein